MRVFSPAHTSVFGACWSAGIFYVKVYSDLVSCSLRAHKWLQQHSVSSAMECDVHLVILGVKEATFPWTCWRTRAVSPSTPLFPMWRHLECHTGGVCRQEQSQSGSRSTFSVSGGVFSVDAVSGWIPRAPLSSCTPFTDSDFVVSTFLKLAVTCSMLVLLEEYLYRFFWEMASRHFRIQVRLVRQCLHVHVSLQRRFGNFTHFCVKVDSAPEVHGGFWMNFLFLRERVLGYGGSWTNLTLFLVKVDSDPEVVSPGAVRTWKFEHYFSGFCFRCRNAALFGLRSSGR